MQIRDRIKELRRVKAGLLRPHPKNWRTHPQAQQDALRGVLAEIGYAGALLARELPDGSLELIDGHLRAETTPDMEVPVLVLDLDDREAAKLLAVHDPLAGMAEANEQCWPNCWPRWKPKARPCRALLDTMLGRGGTAARRTPTPRGGAGGSGHSRMLSSRDRVRRRGAPADRLRAADGEGFTCRLLTM